MNTPTKEGSQFDVVIVGAALSGAATAILLLQDAPTLKVLIIDRADTLSRRVGEATVEISSYFLMRCLGLTKHLNEHHLTKNGLRFWFNNEQCKTIEDCSEIGGKYLSRVPAYLVDRSTLDEEVLRRAVAMGAQLWRPAQVQKVELRSGQTQVVTVKYQEQVQEITPRWVVDASGVAALLARQNGWWRPNPAHPTAAVWSRWKNVKDFDSLEIAQKFPKWAMQCHGIRSTATNHLFGDGWWAWWIPLKGGDVSIGITFDQRLMQFPEGGSIGDRLKTFLMQHPVARELMADATWTEGDVHWRKNLAYYSTTFVGNGFAIVGDAAGFIDPFYSPGMDWISFTSFSAKELILAERRGECIEKKVSMQNETFVRSYSRWFEAIYRDKYEYMAEFDFLRPAFLLDLGLYYMGVASQPFKRGAKALIEPVYSTPPSLPFFYFMRFYNRRFAQMARVRRERNLLGRKNSHQRFLFGGYTFNPNTSRHMFTALFLWMSLEITEGWRSWFGGKTSPGSTAVETVKPAIVN